MSVTSTIIWPLRALQLTALGLGLATLSACDSGTGPTPLPDPESPKITCPAPVMVNSLDGGSLNVTYSSATIIGGKVPVTIACTPESNSQFPIGDTSVSCVATDALQRRDSCSFKVSVVAPPTLKSTTFAAFGDSITEGNDGTNELGVPLPLVYLSKSYPEVLSQRLKQTYTKQTAQISVLNAGYSGEYAGDPETLTRFNRDVLRSGQQVLMLLEGANDITFPKVDQSLSEQRALTNLGVMIDQAKSIGMRVYLATLLPQRQPTGSNSCPPIPTCRGWGHQFVGPFNDRLRTLAAQKNVTLVDLNAEVDLSYIGPDGLHPSFAGFEKMADVFLRKFRETISASFALPWATGRFSGDR